MWKNTYRAFYEKVGTGALNAENLTVSAQWVADLAQVYGAFVLTWLGLVLSLDNVGTAFVVLTLAVMVVPVLLNFVTGRGSLHRRRDIIRTPYSLTQLSVVAVNAICLLYLART